MLGIDTNQCLSLETMQKFHKWGARFIGRYLRNLTPAEVQDIAAAQLYLLSIYETDPTYVKYFTRGQGTHDGETARRQAMALGQPAGTVIFATVDMDLAVSELSALDGYLPGYADALGRPYLAGLYGSAHVLQYASGPKVHRRWQTMAWSAGEVYTEADIYQLADDVSVFGVTVDIDWARSTQGLWIPPGMKVPGPATI